MKIHIVLLIQPDLLMREEWKNSPSINQTSNDAVNSNQSIPLDQTVIVIIDILDNSINYF